MKKEKDIKKDLCVNCLAKDSIRWDKRTIDIEDKQGSYKDLSFNYCNECGNVTNVEFE
jgi:hypothetical protein